MLFLLALLPLSIVTYNMSYYSSICKSFDPQCLVKTDNVINVITENIHNIHNIPYYIIFIPLPIIIECDLLRVYHIELRLFTAYYSLVIDIYF